MSEVPLYMKSLRHIARTRSHACCTGVEGYLAQKKTPTPL